MSNGLPYALAWREDGNVLWIHCGSTGSGSDKSIVRYLRMMTILGPGDIEENSADIDAIDDESADVRRAVPADVLEALRGPEQ